MLVARCAREHVLRGWCSSVWEAAELLLRCAAAVCCLCLRTRRRSLAVECSTCSSCTPPVGLYSSGCTVALRGELHAASACACHAAGGVHGGELHGALQALKACPRVHARPGAASTPSCAGAAAHTWSAAHHGASRRGTRCGGRLDDLQHGCAHRHGHSAVNRLTPGKARRRRTRANHHKQKECHEHRANGRAFILLPLQRSQ